MRCIHRQIERWHTNSYQVSACLRWAKCGDTAKEDTQGQIHKLVASPLLSLISRSPSQHAARELYYWAKLQHPNVIPLLGLSLFRNQISMISEWMENGNLMSFLELHPDAERLGFVSNSQGVSPGAHHSGGSAWTSARGYVISTTMEW